MTKWAHYFAVYEREFSRFRQEPISFMEIGIFKGGSIPMWKEFFHPESRLVFIDIDPECRAHACRERMYILETSPTLHSFNP